MLPVLLHPVTRTAVLALLLAAATASAVSTMHLKEGYEQSSLAADNHVLVQFDNAAAIFRRNIGARS